MSEFKPDNVSKPAWDAARHFLSVGFTVPIGVRLDEVVALATNIHNIQSYDYDMVTWEEFKANDDISVVHFDRANQYYNDGGFDFVVYDPLDDENGYMLVGNDAMKLSQEACDYIAASYPDEGPLSEDILADLDAMSQVEGF